MNASFLNVLLLALTVCALMVAAAFALDEIVWLVTAARQISGGVSVEVGG